MKVVQLSEIQGTERRVECPNGGFTSFRFLLEKDAMGFSMTKTVIPAGRTEVWHYKNHLEACYCISGKAILIENETKEYHSIQPDTMYDLDTNDSHTFMSIEETILICVFNPPLTGLEVHREDGSYAIKGDKND